VDLKAGVVETDTQPVSFDYLIVGTGAGHSYFGHDDWAQKAPGLKTIEDALDIRRRIFLAYEQAERETDPERRRAFMTFVVIGAGSHCRDGGRSRDLARPRPGLTVDPRSARNPGRGWPGSFRFPKTPPGREQLERLVSRCGRAPGDGDRLRRCDPWRRLIGARTIIWAAGVQAPAFVSPRGKGVGEPDLRAAPERLVAGDLLRSSRMRPRARRLSGGHAGGKTRARNIARFARGSVTFAADKGLAVIGRGAAVGDLFGWKMSGRLARSPGWDPHTFSSVSGTA
jgi:NADH dehydrogenase